MSAQPAEEASLPKQGDVIGGKYLVEGTIGTGGMGIVVAARHLALKQRVAVKVLLPEAAALPEASERFVREAQAVASIQSEHVARVLDVGTMPGGGPYMVMEFLAGHDFGKLLKIRGRLMVDVAVDFILQAGEAIAEAHALGIVHRDLKPANLFLTLRPDGSPLVKILDFGLSKATGTPGIPDGNLTATGLVVGSSYYMAPEQFRGLRYADARTDLWALGAILFQLVTGRRPFDGDSFGAVCASVAADPPLSLRGLRSDVPLEFEAVILRCLEKDRERRVQTMADLALALMPFGSPTAAMSVERIVRLLGDARPAPPGTVPLPAVSSGPGSGATPISGAAPILRRAPISTARPLPGVSTPITAPAGVAPPPSGAPRPDDGETAAPAPAPAPNLIPPPPLASAPPPGSAPVPSSALPPGSAPVPSSVLPPGSASVPSSVLPPGSAPVPSSILPRGSAPVPNSALPPDAAPLPEPRSGSLPDAAIPPASQPLGPFVPGGAEIPVESPSETGREDWKQLGVTPYRRGAKIVIVGAAMVATALLAIGSIIWLASGDNDASQSPDAPGAAPAIKPASLEPPIPPPASPPVAEPPPSPELAATAAPTEPEPEPTAAPEPEPTAAPTIAPTTAPKPPPVRAGKTPRRTTTPADALDRWN